MKTLWLILLFPLLATGQAKPPAPHKFLDTENLFLQGFAVAGQGADLWSTQVSLSRGQHELNPLMQSVGARVGFKLVAVGASVGIAYAMHRAGCHKAERAIPVIVGGIGFTCTIHNAVTR